MNQPGNELDALRIAIVEAHHENRRLKNVSKVARTALRAVLFGEIREFDHDGECWVYCFAPLRRDDAIVDGDGEPLWASAHYKNAKRICEVDVWCGKKVTDALRKKMKATITMYDRMRNDWEASPLRHPGWEKHLRRYTEEGKMRLTKVDENRYVQPD